MNAPAFPVSRRISGFRNAGSAATDDTDRDTDSHGYGARRRGRAGKGKRACPVFGRFWPVGRVPSRRARAAGAGVRPRRAYQPTRLCVLDLPVLSGRGPLLSAAAPWQYASERVTCGRSEVLRGRADSAGTYDRGRSRTGRPPRGRRERSGSCSTGSFRASSTRYRWRSVPRMICASIRAKWRPMQRRGPPPKGR